MMNYQEFMDHVTENIKRYLPDTYKDATVEIQQITKNNGIVLDGLLIRKGDINITPTIYLNDYYKYYSNGKEMRDILHEISSVQQRYELNSDIDVSRITDLDRVRDYIVPRVVNAEKNEGLLKERPHTMMDDLAITYHIEIGESDNGKMTVPIHNGLLEQFGISKEELHDIAMGNIEGVMKPELMSMRQMLTGMMPDGMGEDMLPPDDGLMHILTSHDRTHGAAVMLDPKTMDMASEKLGDFYILPSSIHEVILLKDDGTANLSDLEGLVKEVNETQVAEQEHLSDHVYAYDKENKEIYRADKKEERLEKMAEKNAKEKEASKEKKSLKTKLNEKGKVVNAKKALIEPNLTKAKAAAL